jgi:hypothetical protein
LESIKGDIRALDTKLTSTRDVIEGKIGSLDMKIDAWRRELTADTHLSSRLCPQTFAGSRAKSTSI